jgi:hypothetical protein
MINFETFQTLNFRFKVDDTKSIDYFYQVKSLIVSFVTFRP